MSSLRTAALGPWAEAHPVLKAQATLALDLHAPVRAEEALQAPSPLPGRPAKPALLPHTLDGLYALVYGLLAAATDAPLLARALAIVGQLRFYGRQIDAFAVVGDTDTNPAKF